MAPRITFPRMFTQPAKPLTVKESKAGPSGKEESKPQNTSKGDPSETAKGKNEVGEVKKERVTLRMLLDKERQEELEAARKTKLQQPEVKEEKKSAGSQSPESLHASQPEMNIKALMRRHGFEPIQRSKQETKQALPTIPQRKAIVYEAEPTQTKDGRLVYREVQSSEDHINYPVKPKGPENKFGLSTIHEDFVVADERAPSKQKKNGPPTFIQTFKSAVRNLFRPNAGPFSRPSDWN